jgi:hypothetical protein
MGLMGFGVVVDPGLVETDHGIDAAFLGRVERGDTVPRAEIRAAVVADVGLRRGDLVEAGIA